MDIAMAPVAQPTFLTLMPFNDDGRLNYPVVEGIRAARGSNRHR